MDEEPAGSKEWKRAVNKNSANRERKRKDKNIVKEIIIDAKLI